MGTKDKGTVTTATGRVLNFDMNGFQAEKECFRRVHRLGAACECPGVRPVRSGTGFIMSLFM
ncbi:hypothetical protein, partial [Thiolapillus sp.]